MGQNQAKMPFMSSEEIWIKFNKRKNHNHENPRKVARY